MNKELAKSRQSLGKVKKILKHDGRLEFRHFGKNRRFVLTAQIPPGISHVVPNSGYGFSSSGPTDEAFWENEQKIKIIGNYKSRSDKVLGNLSLR